MSNELAEAIVDEGEALAAHYDTLSLEELRALAIEAGLRKQAIRDSYPPGARQTHHLLGLVALAPLRPELQPWPGSAVVGGLLS